MFTCVQKPASLKLLHNFFININIQFLLNRCYFFLMIMAINFAVSENIFDYFFQFFVFHEVDIIKDEDMTTSEQLEQSHTRLVKDMYASCCLCIHSDHLGRKVFFNVDLIDIGLIDKSDVRFFKAKIFHIEHILSLHCIFLKNLYFSWSEVVIIDKYVANFPQAFYLSFIQLAIVFIAFQFIIDNKIFGFFMPILPNKLLHESFNKLKVILHDQFNEVQFEASQLIIDISSNHFVDHVSVFIGIQFQHLYDSFTFFKVLFTFTLHTLVDIELYQIIMNIFLVFLEDECNFIGIW